MEENKQQHEENTPNLVMFGKLLIKVGGLDIVCPDVLLKDVISDYKVSEDDNPVVDMCINVHETKDIKEALKIVGLKYLTLSQLMDLREELDHYITRMLEFMREHPELRVYTNPKDIIKGMGK